MDEEKFYNWEKMNISFIIYLMIKWFNYDRVEMITRNRSDVESTVWIDITIEKGSKKGYVSGQRLDVVHTRLIAFLDRENIRAEYLLKRNQSQS